MRTKKFSDLVPWRRRSGVPVELHERPLRRMHQDIDRVFDRFFDDFFGDLEPFWRRGQDFPSLDMVEEGKDLVVAAEIPGMDPKDIDISLDGDHLVISGEKKSEYEDKSSNRVYTERSFGRFERRLQLPEGVEADKVEASFKNGVLRIRVPRPEKSLADSKRIPIQISS